MTTTDPRRGHALERYRAGATGREIAAEFAVAASTVRRWIAQVEQVRRTGPRGRVDVPDSLIVELRDVERLSFAGVAHEVGMSKSGVVNRYRVATEGARAGSWRVG